MATCAAGASSTLAQIFAAEGKSQICWSELAQVLARLDGTTFTAGNISKLFDGFNLQRSSDVHVLGFLEWLCEGQRAERRGAARTRTRHLVLHFDINKTIVMVDSVTSKSMRDIANHVLASTSWGRAEGAMGSVAPLAGRGVPVGAVWRCACAAPSVKRPSAELISYAEYLEAKLPGQESKELREAQWHVFTHAGQPGEAMLPHCEAFLASLRLPNEVVGTELAKAVGLHGKEVFIIPAFFELLLHLKCEAISFCLVFRTFGQDLREVATEFNAFCEGRHPLFPAAVLDGRDGGTDYRLSLDDPSRFGTFFRGGISGTEDALVYGTLLQPKLKDGLEFYRDSTKFPNIRIVSGSISAIHQDLRKCTNRPGTLAFRDYFPLWRSEGMGDDPKKLNGGKLMVIEPCTASGPHSVFFDDNISETAPKIVDVRQACLPHKVMSLEYLSACHLVRVEPLESVSDPQYFVKHVERLASAYERRVAARARLRALLWEAARQGAFARARELPLPAGSAAYDAWSSRRQDGRRRASGPSFPEPAPPDVASPRD